MIETKEREINGATYQATTFPARRALTIGTRLAHVVGPAVGKLGGAIKIDGETITEFDGSVIPEVVKLLLANLDSNKIVTLIQDLLASTTRVDPETQKRQEVNNDKVFDVLYAANFGELFGALCFAVEVSVGNFSEGSGISNLIQKASALAARASSPPASSNE